MASRKSSIPTKAANSQTMSSLKSCSDTTFKSAWMGEVAVGIMQKWSVFWWALKYEDIKIKAYVSLPQLRFGVQHYVNFYNTRRIHSALQYKTPDEVYFGICNPANRGYFKTRAFTPIFL